MREILSRWGFRCDLCLAYRWNVVKNPANRQVLNDGWFKHFGLWVEPENIICDGCLDDQCLTLDLECPIRPCAVAKTLANCVLCDQYGCDYFKERLFTFEMIQARFKETIPDEYRERFIRPFENAVRFDMTRRE